MSLVTVIVPCYNAAPFVREMLQSVLTQTGTALQVVVVDDGSTDESAGIVAREFPTVELVRTPNRGASAARNTGLERAQGEFVQFVDADDLLGADKLARHLQALQETNADVASGDWQFLVPDGNGSYRLDQVVSHKLTVPELELLQGSWSPLTTYLFRRASIERVGGFRLELPIVQDARFVMDCALQGLKFVHVRGVACAYRVHPTQLSRNQLAFVQDCLLNADQVQAWWRAKGVISPERHTALVHTYEGIARTSYLIDRETFNKAYHALQTLEPHYAPSAPRSLALASRLVGYPQAEALSVVFRRVKRWSLSLLGRLPPEPIHSNTPR